FLADDNHNVLKLILGDMNNTSENGERYEYSVKLFKRWIDKGYLIKDKKNCIYVYSQQFEQDGETIDRTGFISLVKIEEFGKNIYPHELTLSDTMINRRVLLEKTRSNVGLIFSLYNDNKCDIDDILEEAKNTTPEFDVYTDFEGVRHRLWVIDNEETIEKITSHMKNTKVLIADGHHRYNTSLDYSNSKPDDELAKHVSMMFVNMKKDGLVIVPTHRLVKNVVKFDKDNLLKKIENDFTVEKIKFNDSNHKEKTREMKRMMKENGKHSFGMYVGNNTLYILTLKNERSLEKQNHCSKEWCNFDINILHSFIIDKLLDIDIKNPEDQGKIDYFKDIHDFAHRCVEKVNRDDFQIAFFVNPPDMETIQKLSENGEIVPQKSTCFYPKVYSGVVIYKFENGEDNF
ncbi:MAG: DUF1015 domain-containing protein, partial [Candidatus Aenigmarchaeota archaeon]|nr:DUF1015 domain-containing protein [Candidatus Aenigmarchaeota archaeon]